MSDILVGFELFLWRATNYSKKNASKISENTFGNYHLATSSQSCHMVSMVTDHIKGYSIPEVGDDNWIMSIQRLIFFC